MDRRTGGISIGISSIIVIFVVVSMAIFAVLSLSTALQEEALAKKFAASVEDYWEADSKAAETANAFAAVWSGAVGAASIEKLARDCGAVYELSGADVLISYSVPIENRAAGTKAEGAIGELHVKLRLSGEFTIEEWRVIISDEDWAPDTHLPVWKG